MVAGEGIAPPSRAYETRELLLLYPAFIGWGLLPQDVRST